MFSFLVLHVAQLGTACQVFGRLSEGNYLCDIIQDGMRQFSSVSQSCVTLCHPMDETMGTSFHHSGTSSKSGSYKGSSEKL